jgi:hypothetical protein
LQPWISKEPSDVEIADREPAGYSKKGEGRVRSAEIVLLWV